jgi:hypothetical protein
LGPNPRRFQVVSRLITKQLVYVRPLLEFEQVEKCEIGGNSKLVKKG